MSTGEYQLSYTASEIDKRLGDVETNTTNISNLETQLQNKEKDIQTNTTNISNLQTTVDGLNAEKLPYDDTKNVQEVIEELDASIIESSLNVKDVEVDLPLENWTEETDGTFSQTVAVDGITSSHNPVVFLKPAGQVGTEEELDSCACISSIITDENSIKFITDEKPTVSFAVVVKNTIVSEEDAAAKVAVLENQVDELEMNLDEHTHHYCEYKTDSATYRLQIGEDGVPRVYTSTDNGTSWENYILAKESDLGLVSIAHFGKDYPVDILPQDVSNKMFLIITTHASNVNGNGMWLYSTQTGNAFAIKNASDITFNISNNNRTISFSCSYSPVMHIYGFHL